MSNPPVATTWAWLATSMTVATLPYRLPATYPMITDYITWRETSTNGCAMYTGNYRLRISRTSTRSGAMSTWTSNTTKPKRATLQKINTDAHNGYQPRHRGNRPEERRERKRK